MYQNQGAVSEIGYKNLWLSNTFQVTSSPVETSRKYAILVRGTWLFLSYIPLLRATKAYRKNAQIHIRLRGAIAAHFLLGRRNCFADNTSLQRLLQKLRQAIIPFVYGRFEEAVYQMASRLQKLDSYSLCWVAMTEELIDHVDILCRAWDVLGPVSTD